MAPVLSDGGSSSFGPDLDPTSMAPNVALDGGGALEHYVFGWRISVGRWMHS